MELNVPAGASNRAYLVAGVGLTIVLALITFAITTAATPPLAVALTKFGI
ncbi:MAG TPA: hypothetical protein VKR22_10090 [Acidimicrobiales bacterium]|nr:hypothetical protein [Acidimicrobiales bacterium]